jgi:hypothetical protein
MLILELLIILTPLAIICFGIWSFITVANNVPEQADLPNSELDLTEHENYWREDRY